MSAAAGQAASRDHAGGEEQADADADAALCEHADCTSGDQLSDAINALEVCRL
jgi:hypothetical protein